MGLGSGRRCHRRRFRLPRTARCPSLLQGLAHLLLTGTQTIEELGLRLGGRGPAAQAIPKALGRGRHRRRFHRNAAHGHVEEQPNSRQQQQPVPDRLQALNDGKPARKTSP